MKSLKPNIQTIILSFLSFEKSHNLAFYSKKYQKMLNITLDNYKCINFIQNTKIRIKYVLSYYSYFTKKFLNIPRDILKSFYYQRIQKYSSNNIIIIRNTDELSEELIQNIDTNICLIINSLKNNKITKTLRKNNNIKYIIFDIIDEEKEITENAFTFFVPLSVPVIHLMHNQYPIEKINEYKQLESLIVGGKYYPLLS